MKMSEKIFRLKPENFLKEYFSFLNSLLIDLRKLDHFLHEGSRLEFINIEFEYGEIVEFIYMLEEGRKRILKTKAEEIETMSEDYTCNDCEYDDEEKLHEKCKDCIKHTKLIPIRGTKDNFKLLEI